MNRFEDKIALVTGAASGIGQATALRLAEEGANVACVDVNAEGLASTCESITGMGREALALECDVSDEAAVAKTLKATIEKFGKLNVLANVAGVLRADHTHELQLADWERILRINLTGTFLMCREAIPHLLEKKGNNIVNTSSTSALGSHPWMAAYAASKGGILSMTSVIAVEYVKKGIRCNAVCPGGVSTPLHGQFSMPKDADPQLLQGAIPLVPYVGPKHAASAIAFLASDDARYMNGTYLRVDGGALS
jgi:meso-butanediol dehydrogenase/(S,S)-butanediol dehydrogenase/diacetyl reductase